MSSLFSSQKQRMQQQFVRRLWVFAALMLLGFTGLLVRYGYLQVVSHDKYVKRADDNRTKQLALPPTRGDIYDRNGIIIAGNHPVFTAVMYPDETPKPKQTLAQLVPIFGLTPDTVRELLTRLEADPHAPLTLKVDISNTEMAQFSERQPFFSGVRIQNTLVRTYPYDKLFAHVLGYVGRINDKDSQRIDKARYAGTDLIGKIGIEREYEDQLLGQPGYQAVETNAHGDILRELATVPAIAGQDLQLSLDYGLQKIATKQLAGRRGAIVAIDPRDGGVLAFVSNPSYDPNPFISGISFADYGALREDEDQPLYNRALQGMYPPGSTIKPFEGLGGIHYGLRTWNTTIFDPGYFSLPGDSHRFRDWKRGGHGTVNLKKSIMMSVDTYYYKLSYEMGIERLHDWMVRFGFGSKTGIDLPNEKAGIMPSPLWKAQTYDQRWLPGETISVSIGQGYFLATPLQIANATAIMANKGKRITPHVIKVDEAKAQTLVSQAPRIDYNGDDDDWQKMQDAMEDTVKNGTARRIYTPLYRIAGKTGTAQVKSIAQGESYDKSKIDQRYWDHAWFNGFAPVDNPQIALAVLVENGGGGSSVAAPIGRALFDYWLLQRPEAPLTPPNTPQPSTSSSSQSDTE